MKMKKNNITIKSKEFTYIYNLLNDHHRKIVFKTLFLMERSYNHPSVNENIYREIERKQDELGIGFTDLYKKICEKNGYPLSKKTYESVRRRKTTNSVTFEDMRDILELTEDDISIIRMQTQLQDQANIEWLFDSLSPENKNAMYSLANLLHVEETLPEFFEDNFIGTE